jgi:hypothetical protein
VDSNALREVAALPLNVKNGLGWVMLTEQSVGQDFIDRRIGGINGGRSENQANCQDPGFLHRTLS